MTDGKVYITISDRRENTNQSNLQVGNNNNSVGSSTKNSSNALGRYSEHQFFNTIQNNAKTFVNYSIANIGNFTGNYLTQQNISISVNNLSKLYRLGLTAVAGAQIGGVIGAGVAVGAQIVSDVVNFGLSERTAYFENKRTNLEILKMKELSGLNALTNSSR